MLTEARGPVAMRRGLLGVALAAGLALGGAGPAAMAADTAGAADSRLAVTLPPEVADAFLAEMRGHMRTLDDIMLALADGDFGAAATIADLRLDFGHRMWDSLGEQGGLSDEQLLAVKRAMQAAGRGPGQGTGQGGGRGFGRYMPEAFRAMGGQFHAAGAAFAAVARAVPAEPEPADYAAVIEALRGVTGMCRACHDAFRVVPAE